MIHYHPTIIIIRLSASSLIAINDRSSYHHHWSIISSHDQHSSFVIYDLANYQCYQLIIINDSSSSYEYWSVIALAALCAWNKIALGA